MKNTHTENGPTTRRDFLKHSGTAVAGAALAGAVIPRVHAAEDNTIKVALIGCGGRGTGAALNALSTNGPTKLVAMADVFEPKIQASLQSLSGQFAAQLDVPKERQFVGFDGYKKAMEAIGPGGVALLTTPPAFRPLHYEHAVAQGCNVFMEKSFAVDAPGIRRVLAAAKKRPRRI